MSLRDKILDPRKGVCLFGTVPPALGTEIPKAYEIGEKLASRISGLDVDGTIVYDLQEEKGMDGNPRNPRHIPTIDSALYSKILQEKTGREAVAYKASPYYPRRDFEQWLEKSWEYGIRNLVMVGADFSTDHPGYPVAEAAELIASSGKDFLLGGVTIPERHVHLFRDEHKRLEEKAKTGMKFFVSQIVYNPRNAKVVLNDYHDHCAQKETDPARIIFTFCPFGTEPTARFIRESLGVDIADKTIQSVLRSEDPLKSSRQICRQNLLKILNYLQYESINIPIGINVETVSKKGSEISAAAELFSDLKHELDSFY